MAIKAVVFDIGGVLERVDGMEWLERWRPPGLSQPAFEAALAGIDPDGAAAVGGLSELECKARYVDALDLTSAQADAFMVDLWDWYCGELDGELVAFVGGLRPEYTTAILSNSADGARREEQRRYDFEGLVDTIIYSHEVGLAKPDPRIYALACDRLGVEPAEMVFLDDVAPIVQSALDFGMHAVLHRDTPDSIARITALLDAEGR